MLCRRIAGPIVLCALAVLLPAGTARANAEVYRQLLHSTGWVIVPGAGKTTSGTCFVVDQQHRLVITCQHVGGDAREALVYFPSLKDGKAAVESMFYLDRMPALVAEVVARDRARDLALLRLESLPDGVKALPLADASPDPGEDVHSVGNSGLTDGGVLWRYTRGSVRLSYEKKVSSSGKERSVRILETQSPVNKGDSGGPVVNDRGQLVGVAAAYTADARLVSENTDVHEVRSFLRESRTASEGPPVKSDDVVPVGIGSPESAPAPEPGRSVVGRWKLTIHDEDGEAGGGTGQFRADKTFAMTPPAAEKKAEKKAHAHSGRYACANGVMMLVLGDEAVIAPLTWGDDDHFTLKVGKVKFGFARQDR